MIDDTFTNMKIEEYNIIEITLAINSILIILSSLRNVC